MERKKITVRKKIALLASLIMISILLFGLLPLNAFAKTGTNKVDGTVYEFDGKSNYVFDDALSSKKVSEGAKTAGSFSVSGNVSNTTDILGVPYFIVEDGNLEIFYNHSNLLNKNEEEWHITEDSGKKIDSISLDKSIENGAIILQTSRDGSKWNNTVKIENTFEVVPNRTEPIYITTETELNNATYYRLIVAYKKRIKSGDSKLIGENYDYKKCAEIFTFCACYKEAAEKNISANKLEHSFGDFIKVKDGNGYSTEEVLDKKDPHFSNVLGNFLVSGFTAKTEKDNGIVFLSNPNDDITLKFNLKADIDALWDSGEYSIADDDKGSDTQYQVKETDMGRGLLIVKFTDYTGKSKTEIHKDFLSACTSAQADTVIELNEEGDYEVALDYKIKKSGLFGTDIFATTTSYKMNFNFKIRNGNCMVYPKDLKTTSELYNSSLAPNGFYLDFAKSRFLEINVKKENLNKTGNALETDVRFSKPAKEGDEFVDEGVYTLTAKNIYTDQTIEKVIYVGDNLILKAYAVTGMPIDEIQTLVKEGATINENGIITIPEPEPTPEPTEAPVETPSAEPIPTNAVNPEPKEDLNISLNIKTLIFVGGGIVAVIILIIIIALAAKKRKQKRARITEDYKKMRNIYEKPTDEEVGEKPENANGDNLEDNNTK